MSEDYIDKLMQDIQQYLRDEDEKTRTGPHVLIRAKQAGRPRRLPRPLFVGLITLLSACAVGSVTVAVLLLGFVGTPAGDTLRIIWLLAAAGCGIFFSAILVSSWKRLVLLDQIEKNTRLILANKRKTNALLDEFIRNMS